MVENHVQLKPVISDVEPSDSATRQQQQLAKEYKLWSLPDRRCLQQ